MHASQLAEIGSWVAIHSGQSYLWRTRTTDAFGDNLLVRLKNSTAAMGHSVEDV